MSWDQSDHAQLLTPIATSMIIGTTLSTAIINQIMTPRTSTMMTPRISTMMTPRTSTMMTPRISTMMTPRMPTMMTKIAIITIATKMKTFL